MTFIPEISLGDYRISALSDAFFKLLKDGTQFKDLDEKSYSYLLPVLKKLEEKM